MSEITPGNGKIFGIGLSKTGTTSLNRAFTRLGYKAVHWHDTRHLIRYVGGQPVIDYSKFDGYDAFTDLPIAIAYKQLDVHYPNSKFILTLRDMDGWLKSIKHHFDSFISPKSSESEDKPLLDKLHLGLYGATGFDEDKFRQAYGRHVGEVMNYFKNRQGDLLVLDICNGDGWEKLCPFLGKPIPKEPFPYSNVRFKRGRKLLKFKVKRAKHYLRNTREIPALVKRKLGLGG